MRRAEIAFTLLLAPAAFPGGGAGAQDPPADARKDDLAGLVEKLGAPEAPVRAAARAALLARGRPAALPLAEAWIASATGEAPALPEVAEFTAARRRGREAWDLLVDLFPGLAFNAPNEVKPEVLRMYARSAPLVEEGTLPEDVSRFLVAFSSQRAAAEAAAARWLEKGGAEDRIAACEAAVRLGDPGLRARAEPILRSGLASGASLRTRAAVARALRLAGSADGLPVLLEALRSGTDADRVAAAAELSVFPHALVAAGVEPWLSGKEPRAAALAAGVLVALGAGPSREAAEAWLRKAVAEGTREVRDAASRVVLSIEGPFSEEMRAQILDLGVEEAVARGVKFLRDSQGGDGAWGSLVTTNPSRGVTALALLALRKSGAPPSDEAVVRALGALRSPVEAAAAGADTPRAYEQYVWAVEMMAFASVDPVAWREPIAERARALLAKQARGAWDYYGKGDGGTGPRGGDTSISQVVMLGLREAALAGVPIAPDVWRAAMEWFLRSQLPDGGWVCDPYWIAAQHGERHLHAATGMTAAGVGSLLISREQLGAALDAKEVERLEKAVDRGLATLGRLFSARPDSRAAGFHSWYHLYYLYGVERAGTLSKRAAFGGKDWYREGATYLLSAQREDGGWAPLPETPNLVADGHRSGAAETAFALLFLRRATRPLLTPRGGGGR